jgi:hypothetical protein
VIALDEASWCSSIVAKTKLRDWAVFAYVKTLSMERFHWASPCYRSHCNQPIRCKVTFAARSHGSNASTVKTFDFHHWRNLLSASDSVHDCGNKSARPGDKPARHVHCRCSHWPTAGNRTPLEELVWQIHCRPSVVHALVCRANAADATGYCQEIGRSESENRSTSNASTDQT